jgi:nitrite reductase/ring-hydroxylating ferredoxin subunit
LTLEECPPKSDRLIFDMATQNVLKTEDYTCYKVFELEKSRIFDQSWHYAGRVKQVSEANSYFSTIANSKNVVIVRNERKQLRAFENTCKHRGAEIVPLGESGCGKLLKCPSHAWTYDLAGRFQGAPFINEGEHLNVARYSLDSLLVDGFGPFIFVGFGKEAKQWKQILSNLSDIFKMPAVKRDELRLHKRQTYAIDANWKLIVEGFLNTKQEPCIGKGIETHGLHKFLWPLFSLSIYPGPANLLTNIIRPISENHTLIQRDFYLSKDLCDSERLKFIDFINLIQRADRNEIEALQNTMQANSQAPTTHRIGKAAHFFQARVKDFCDGCHDASLQKV